MPIFVLDVQVMNLIVKHILEAERNQTHMLLEKQTPPPKKKKFSGHHLIEQNQYMWQR